MRFIELTLRKGPKIWVNMELVTDMVHTRSEATVLCFAAPGEDGVYSFNVEETPEEILKRSGVL